MDWLWKYVDAIQATPIDLLEVWVGLMITHRAKVFKENFNWLLQDTWSMLDFKNMLNSEEKVLINVIHVQEGFSVGI